LQIALRHAHAEAMLDELNRNPALRELIGIEDEETLPTILHESQADLPKNRMKTLAYDTRHRWFYTHRGDNSTWPIASAKQLWIANYQPRRSTSARSLSCCAGVKAARALSVSSQ
jgi:hypothetical protein